MSNSRAPRNRTIELTGADKSRLRKTIGFASALLGEGRAQTLVCGDAIEILASLSGAQLDLLFADPPYNLTKKFGTESSTVEAVTIMKRGSIRG